MISFFVVNLTVFANIETASFKKFSFINKREISFEISSLKFNFYRFNTFCFEIDHSFVLSIDHETVPYIPFAILTLIINRFIQIHKISRASQTIASFHSECVACTVVPHGASGGRCYLRYSKSFILIIHNNS